MKMVRILVMLAAALCCAPAIAVQDGKDAQVRTQKDTKASGKILDIGSSNYPTTSGRNFSIVKGGVGTGLDVTCSGVDLENILRSYFGVDFKSIMEYVASNAAGLALTYFIYSNPTLYSLLQDLKRAGDFALNANMLSCSSIRQMADNARKRAIEAQGMDKCISERGSNLCSSDGRVLEEYKRQAVQEYEAQLKSKSYNANATVHDFLTYEMDLSPEARDLIGAVLPNEKATGSELQKTSPSKTVSMLMRESYDKRLEHLKKIIEAKRTNNLKEYGTLGESALRDGIEPINEDAIGALVKYPSREQDVLIRRLAARQAYGDVVSRLREVSETIRGGMLKGDKSVTLFDYQKVEVRDALSVIDNMIQMLKLEYEALDDQRVYMLNIIRNAPSGLK